VLKVSLFVAFCRLLGLRFGAIAIPHVQDNWIDNSTDPAVREAARAYFTTLDVLTEKQAKAFEGGVPTARVIRLRGDALHIFIK
jgi:hypothetical protein